MNLHVSTCLYIFHDFIGHVVKMAMYFRHIVLNIDNFFFYRYSQQDVLGSKQDPCKPNGMSL